MNKGTIIGFISSDIKSDTITLKNGETMSKVSFNVACQRKGKNAGADFPRFVAMGRTAEVISQYFHKGKGIILNYHIQTGSYTNKDGKTIYTTDLMIDSIEFLPIRKDEEITPVSNYEQPAENDTHTEEYSAPPKQPDNEFMNIPDDVDNEIGELPFR